MQVHRPSIERESAADEGRSWLARELQLGVLAVSGPLLEPAVISYGIYPPDDAAPSQGFFFSILIVAPDSISIYSLIISFNLRDSE